MRFNHLPSAASQPSGELGSLKPAAGTSAAASLGVHKYSFNIGSVETFERKLEEVQEDMGVDPRNLVPVTYVTEVSWMQELGRLVPTLLLLAGYIWFTQRQMGGGGMGGMGGGGGGRGIFNVGKATVRCSQKSGSFSCPPLRRCHCHCASAGATRVAR